jgi:arylsulfatase A-like enzyme
MSTRGAWTCGLTLLAATMMTSPQAIAQQQQKPNILFIMGDDIGWMQPSFRLQRQGCNRFDHDGQK